MTDEQIFCTAHSFGPITENGTQKKEHDNNDCKWEEYDPKVHLDEYEKKLIIEDDVLSNISFQSSSTGKIITKDILNYKIRTLRPITYFKTENTKMILVYLPTKKTIEKTKKVGDDEEEIVSTEIQWVNCAYFLISKTDSNGNQTRQILPSDHKSLQENYRINILSEWNDVRWSVQDCKNWINDTELSNPKELYEEVERTTRQYLEYADDEYPKFNLWNIGTYFYELFDAYPYNDFTGTKRAGKTKSLELQKHVCFNAIMTPDMTGPSLFRLIEGIGATILLDETEEFKNKKNEQAQALRNLLMQSFLKDQYAIRSDTTKDKNFTPTQYNIYSPKSLAHINSFDDVLDDRCIKQINRRALDEKIKNTWVSEDNPSFQVIRNKCYRLYLDYGDQIYDLQTEARTTLGIGGRELQLWTPIMTLALFFEKFGVTNLVNKVMRTMKESTENRLLSDEESSKDLRVLNYLSEYGVTIAKNQTYLKNNKIGWIPITELYRHFSGMFEEYQINAEFFTRHTLTLTLKRFGFVQKRKEGGISWCITEDTVNEIKQRMGVVDYHDDDENNLNGDLEKKASFPSEGSVLGVNNGKIYEKEKFRNEVKSSESSENYSKGSENSVNNGKSSGDLHGNSRKTEQNEVNEENNLKESATNSKKGLENSNDDIIHGKLSCKDCNQSWVTNSTLGEIQKEHSKQFPNHTVVPSIDRISNTKQGIIQNNSKVSTQLIANKKYNFACQNCTTIWKDTSLPLEEIQTQHSMSNENHTIVQVNEGESF